MAIDSTLDALVHRTRISQFVSVGVVGASIETVIVALLTATVGVAPLAAKAVGAEVSISTMFVINDRWTFASEGDAGVSAFVRRWGKSHLVRLVGLSVAFVILYFLTGIVQFSIKIAGLNAWPTIANGIGIGVGMLINYVAESLLTWDVAEVIDDV